MFIFVPLVLISGNFWKSLPFVLTLFRKIGLPIKCPVWLKVSFIEFKCFSLSFDILNPCIYVITKIHFEGICTSFARGNNSLGDSIAMLVMLILLMESTPRFAWPRNVIASVQALMTGIIHFLMSLAVNPLLFFSFTKSLVTWVMAMVPFSTPVWILWKRKLFPLSLNIKSASQISTTRLLQFSGLT